MVFRKLENGENPKMKSFVIDTSVVVKWFCNDENDSEIAIILREKMFEGSYSFTAPDLLLYELANALRYNSKFTTKDVKDALNSIFDMGIETKKSDRIITAHAIDLAFKFNITVYDAYFMALCQNEKKSLITADYKFVDRVRGFKEIVKLSEFF